MPFSILDRGERILLTFWVGGMWAIGYLAAPVLFNVLDDRQLAGTVAGHLFTAMSYIGLACGTLLLASQFYRRTQKAGKPWRLWLLIMMLVIIAVGQFVLQPMMAELKAGGLAEGSPADTRFGRLHGIAAMLFLVNSVAGLVLVISGTPSRTTGSD
jgi:uncharacterized membrane protein YhaH (DUF805 family)